MKTEEIHKCLVNGISRYFKEAGIQKAVVGLSGGIDSALVATLAIDALGVENVHALLMPGPFSTIHSLTDAIKLCELQSLSHHIIPIDGIFNKFLRELAPAFEHAPQDVTEENIQARIRSTLLMAYANKKKALVLNTSNKSELAMGYGTLYGDLAGALMVIADIYKTQVYELAEYLNANGERIPKHTIEKEPSAELHTNQKDSDSLPPYPVLDPILYALVEEGRTAEELIKAGHSEKEMEIVLSKMSKNKFKGFQCPPLLQVTDKPLLHSNKCIEVRGC